MPLDCGGITALEQCGHCCGNERLVAGWAIITHLVGVSRHRHHPDHLEIFCVEVSCEGGNLRRLRKIGRRGVCIWLP
ncbi:hypothetical protein EBF16_26150 [Sphingobium yanoikuyae]|uniref:Uncharacterized protein n=1 Tax=Sphingobium yanoikuyae TaxID=13690 RepID=A0A3G2UZD7_SPHYA|nr:hypothetical protein EBF16_26150 [Sphingobium yanoikuyae]